MNIISGQTNVILLFWHKHTVNLHHRFRPFAITVSDRLSFLWRDSEVITRANDGVRCKTDNPSDIRSAYSHWPGVLWIIARLGSLSKDHGFYVNIKVNLSRLLPSIRLTSHLWALPGVRDAGTCRLMNRRGIPLPFLLPSAPPPPSIPQSGCAGL